MVARNPDKVDRRVSRTQEAFGYAALALMRKYAWQDISISMLCEEANVSRTTFYSNFATKDQLLEQLFGWIEFMMTEFPAEGRGLDMNGTFGFLPTVLNETRARKQIVQRQKNNLDGYALAHRFRVMIGNMMQMEFEMSRIPTPTKKHLTFLAGALSAQMQNWIDENFAESEEEMLEILDDYVRDFFVSQKINSIGYR